MLLDWLARRRDDDALAHAAQAIEAALDTVIANPATRTRDMGGPAATAAFTAAVVAEIEG